MVCCWFNIFASTGVKESVYQVSSVLIIQHIRKVFIIALCILKIH